LQAISYLRKFYLILSFLIGLLVIGVVGYMLIEGYNFRESFFMTVITLSTVGYKEVQPLSPEGQWFTSFLIIGSFGTFAYGFSVLAQSVLSGELAAHLKRRRLDHTIDKLENHTVICGFGRNGRRAYEKLRAYGQPVLVVDIAPESTKNFYPEESLLFIAGDATNDEILQRAGLERAKALVSTLSKDSDNLFVAITARAMNPRLRLVCRASNESTEKKLRAVGADAVVMPEAVGGGHMATLTLNPNIVEFLDHISVDGVSNINLEEISLQEFTRQEDCSLQELQIRQKTGCTVIGLKTPEGAYHINPGSNEHISPGSRLFVLGNKEQITALNQYLKSLK